MRLAFALYLCASTAAAAAEPRFSDHANAFPVSHSYTGGWTHFVGGGAAVFDCNGNAKPDIFVAGGASPARLFVNTTEGHEPTFKSGALEQELLAVTGAYPIDIDSDGAIDLVVLRNGENLLLRNDGKCGFTNANDVWGFDGGNKWSTAFSATWEKDRTFPTLAIGNYVDQTAKDGPFERCDVNSLYRPISEKFGKPIELAPGFCALSMLFSDWRRSGTAELRISNDRHYYLRGGYEQMWMLDPLRERGPEDGWEKVSLWGMGIASTDLAGDSYPDVMLTSMGDQVLMMNDGEVLTRAPYELGTTAHRPHTGDDGRPSTGWHAEFGDVNNDGLQDLFIAKGNVDQMPGLAMEDPNNLLLQKTDGSFEETATPAGIATTKRSRGAALADFNGDGRLDILVINRRAPLELWINETEEVGHWASVEPTITGPNRDAIGAWIEIDRDGQTEWRERTIGGGHVSGSLLPIHIGLGDASEVRVRVHWPHGGASDWRTLLAGDRLAIEKP